MEPADHSIVPQPAVRGYSRSANRPAPTPPASVRIPPAAAATIIQKYKKYKCKKVVTLLVERHKGLTTGHINI